MTALPERYPIAIDFDGQELFALQLQPVKGGVCIRNHFRYPLVPRGQGSATRADRLTGLRKLKRVRGFSGRRVVIHLPLDQTLCFPVDVSVKKDQSLDEAILLEAEKNLPYGLEDAVIDYPSITPTALDHHYTATIVAAKRQEVMELFDICKQAGFLTDAVDFSPISLIRLHHFLFEPSQTPYMVCYIGGQQSFLQVVSQERIYAFSKFVWGRDLLVDKLNHTLAFTDDGANALDLLQTHGISEGPGERDEKTARIVARIITPAIEELVFEFHKVLGYARTKEKIHEIGQVYFYGFASMIKGLDTYFGKWLNIPVFQADIKDKIKPVKQGISLTPDRAALYPVLGLAMRKVPWL